MKTLRFLLLFAMITLLAACGGGGGGGGTPAKTVTLKVSTVDDPLATSSATGVNMTITLPAGVTAGANPVTVSGVAVNTPGGGTTPGAVLSYTYTPASGSTNGTLQFIMASGLAAGFNVGEFATVVLSYSGAATLLTGDFPVASYTIINETLPAPSVVTGVKAAVTAITVH